VKDKNAEHLDECRLRTIIFSHSTPAQVELCLRSYFHSIERDLQNSRNDVCVMYRPNSRMLYNQYKRLEHDFPGVRWIRVRSFLADLHGALDGTEYVLFLLDQTVFSRKLDVSAVMNAIGNPRSRCIGFSLRLGESSNYCHSLNRAQEVPPFEHLGSEVCQLNWTKADADFAYPMEVSASFYCSDLIRNLLQDSRGIENALDLERHLDAKKHVLSEKLPNLLIFSQPVAFVNLHGDQDRAFASNRNVVSRECLIHALENNQRIDDSVFWGYSNASAHVDIAYVLQPRPERDSNTLDQVFTKPPLLSVIIPCYNYGRYVREAVNSVKTQTLPGIEIIVVDGGSDDPDTRRIVSELQNEGVTVYVRNGRHMAGSNRNFGIERCNAEYVCCLDADDYLHPTYLEKAVFNLISGGFDIVGCGAKTFGESESLRGVKNITDNRQILESNSVMSASLFRKSLWREVGGYEDFGFGVDHIHEDWHFWCKCALANARIHNLEREYLIHYRIHGDSSLSRQNGMVRSDLEHRGVIQKALEGRRFKYQQIFDTTTEISSFTEQARDWVSLMNYPGKPETYLIFFSSYSKKDADLLSSILEPFHCQGIPFTVMLNGSQDSEEFSDYAGVSNWSTVYDLDRFIDNDTQKKAFVEFYLKTRTINWIGIWGFDGYNQYFSNLESIDHSPQVFDLCYFTEDRSASPYSSYQLKNEALNQISITPLPFSHPDSKGREVWILDILDEKFHSLMTTSMGVLLPKGWRILNSEGSPKGFAVVSENGEPLMLNLPTGSTIRFLQHAYSSQIRIENISRSTSLVSDLYSPSPDIRNVLLDSLY